MTKHSHSRQEKIYQTLKKEIQAGTYQQGDYLPPVRELGLRFQTSITPVYLAITRLATDGYVTTAHGSGVQVVAQSGREAQVQRKPGIDFLGSTPNFLMGEAPRRRHLIIASSDWLLWGLTHSKDVRVAVSHFTYNNPQAFFDVLEECLYTESKVIAFAGQENINDKTLHLLNQLQKNGKHIAHLGNREDFPHFDRVRSDFRAGSHALTRHLLAQGHTCLLRLHTSFSNWYEMKKQEGFQSAIEEWNQEHDAQSLGLTRAVDLMKPTGGVDEAEWDESLLREVLQFHPVTAILAPSDASVLYLRVAAAKLGREDLVIAGYDNTWDELEDIHPHADFIHKHFDKVRFNTPPPSVEVNAALLGTELAQLAIQRALGKLPASPQTVMCPQTLTTGP